MGDEETGSPASGSSAAPALASEEYNDNLTSQKSSRREYQDSSFGSFGHITSDRPPPSSLRDHTKTAYVFTILIGLAMTFSAGYTNGVCLSGFIHVGEITTKASVAGVTGVYTQSAIYIGEDNLSQAGFMFGTIFSVMFGAFTAAVMNPFPIAFEVSPRYGPTFLTGSFLMALGAVAALHNNRREFFFTAMANGVQNGVSSMYSANLLRTSHLTGTTTDIGLFLGMAVRGNRTNNWKLYILVGLAASFWLGSISGFFASQVKRQYSLIFNACFFFAISICVILRTCRVYRVPLWQAILGVGKWSMSIDHLDITQEDVGKKDDDAADGDRDVTVDELLKVFDEIDKDNNGRVNQQSLIECLTSHHCKVQKKRKPLVEILHAAFTAHGDEGDWALTREDWNRLIRSRRSSIASSAQPQSASMRFTEVTGPAAGPEALRRMSIQQYKQTAHFQQSARFRSSVRSLDVEE